MANRIYLCLAHMSETGMEQKYIKEAFDTNWVVSLGPNVNGFEQDLKERIKRYSPGSEILYLIAGDIDDFKIALHRRHEFNINSGRASPAKITERRTWNKLFNPVEVAELKSFTNFACAYNFFA